MTRGVARHRQRPEDALPRPRAHAARPAAGCANFQANRRGYWSLWIFLLLFVVSLFAEFIANDRPILVVYDGAALLPDLPGLSGDRRSAAILPTEADYRDPDVRELIEGNGWMIWPPIPYNYRTVAWDLPAPAPSPPGAGHWLGTDDQARDVLARLIYGFRISVLFGLALTVVSLDRSASPPAPCRAISAAGSTCSSSASWRSGRGCRMLYILIILASIVEPNFWWLLGHAAAVQLDGLVGVVRAEFLRARNFDYVRAARALGVGEPGDHVPPRAAQRHGRDPDLHAVHPVRLDHRR